VHNDHIDPILFASAYAAEEAIINSMIAAEPMTGHLGVSIESLPHDKLVDIMKEYKRIS
jgi:D-aminopeptidase